MAALAIALLDIRRRLRDRSLLIQGVAGPVLLAGIIGFAFGGGGGGSIAVELGVADADRSELSTAVLDGLRDAAAEGDGPPVMLVDLDTGDDARTAVDGGAVDAALVVPAGFGDDVLAGRDVSFEVLTTGERRISGDLAVAVAEQLAGFVDARRLAVAAATAAGLTPPDAALEPVLAVVEEPVGGDFDAVAFFAPSMAILFLFFTVGAGARSVLRERADGTLSRVRASPIPASSVLTGKAIAVLVSGTVSLAVVWAITSLVFGADWGDPAGVALVLVGVVVAVSGIAAVLTGLTRSEAQADSITSAVAFVLALVGGNFISPGALPPLLERASLLTPNGWALQALVELSAGGAGVGDVVPAFVVLVSMGLVAGLVGTRLLARSVA